MLFTLPDTAAPVAPAAPPSRDELEKALRSRLEVVDWNEVTQYPNLLSRTSAPVFAMDLPTFKDPGVPEMTLAPHPDGFYTRKHADDVHERLKVWTVCARLLEHCAMLTLWHARARSVDNVSVVGGQAAHRHRARRQRQDASSL